MRGMSQILINSHDLQPQSEQHGGSEEVRFHKSKKKMKVNVLYFVEYRENLFSPFVMEREDAVVHSSFRYCAGYST